MDNENLEIDLKEDIEVNEVVESYEDNSVSDDVSINDVSEIEDVPEKIILEDSDVENIEVSDDSQDLEQLLRNYFSNNLSSDSSDENIDSVSELDSSENDNSEPVVPDYTYVLDRIRSNTSHTYSGILGLQSSFDDFNDNNSFSASVEDISLTNQLLLVLIIVLLFNGLLDFARRIF